MADVNSICPAFLSIGDDEGDNSVTFHCQLPIGHAGLHCEQFHKEHANDSKSVVVVLWECDSRIDEWEDAHTLLSLTMDHPPSIEIISQWTDAQRAKVTDWAMWQDFEDIAKEYPRPDWLKDSYEDEP